MSKIRVGILFGGKSAEHEVSLQSAKNVIEAIDKEKYEVVPIGIDKQGQWHVLDAADYLLNPDNPKRIALKTSSEPISIVPGQMEQPVFGRLDAIFPVLHGTNGEDGTVQGLLKLLDISFVGPGVLGSAINMDKDIEKRLLAEAGIPVARWVTLIRGVNESHQFDAIAEDFGLPLFVKPANAGSSVGVSRVTSEEEFNQAVTEAFTYDRKVLVEQAVVGREIECAVLGNEKPEASLPGEILLSTDYYSYEAKYIDPNAATGQVPADLPPDIVKRVQEMAIKTFQTLECEGMARVDFFLKEDGELVVNEVNTIPGFTNISMYPKMWAASGLDYPQLIDRLIQLAIERYRRDAVMRTNYTD